MEGGHGNGAGSLVWEVHPRELTKHLTSRPVVSTDGFLLRGMGAKVAGLAIALDAGTPSASEFVVTHALVGRLGTLHSAPRSEEHTSELQSRENLVCRLLL